MGAINISKLQLTDEQKAVVLEAKTSLKKHGQAAILLSTGGGKSYISAKLIRDLKGSKKNYKILWISTRTSIDNTKNLLKDNYFSESITYIAFSELATHTSYVDNLDIKKVDLIVIDEAHRALAHCTEIGIKYTLKKFNKAKIIAMTATKIRYSDRKNVFEYITPKLKLGVDYQDRGLKYSIDNSLVCEFVYKTCNVKTLKTYCKAIRQMQEYSSIYNEYKYVVKEAEELIKEYDENTFNKLGNLIRQDLVYDGTEGDRWFVFYSTIDELRENISAIKDMFKIAYNNDELAINVIEYHSDNKDDTIIDRINSAPEKNSVDIILTCNKGSESLHPINTRGIVMLRNTASETVATQQLGRALQARAFADGIKYVYDFVNNKERIEAFQTIAYGMQSPEDRQKSSIENTLNQADKDNGALDRIIRKYNGCIEVELLDDNMNSLLNKFKEIRDIFENILAAKRIDEIFKFKKGENYKNVVDNGLFNPIQVLTEYDTEYNTKYAKSFEVIQKAFLNGQFGEHKANEPVINDIYYEVYNTLGNMLYVTPENPTDIGYTFIDLIKIAEAVAGYNFDYANRISKTKELKNKIADLRSLALNNKLSVAYYRFCIRNMIDIDGIYSNILYEILESSDAPKYPELIFDYKKAVKAIKSLDFDNEENKPEKSAILNVLSLIHIFEIKYKNIPLGIQATAAIKIKFRNEIAELRRYVSREEYVRATRIVSTITKMRYLYMPDTAKELQDYASRIDEYSIIDLVKRNETGNVTEYEYIVLNNMGVKTDNTRKDANIRKLLDRTPFGIAYDRFIKEPNVQLYNFLNRYNIDGLPLSMQQRLKTSKYKDSKNQAEKEIVLMKDSEEVRGIVAHLYYSDASNIEKIREAIKNNEVDSRVLIKYAIPKQIFDMNSKEFNLVINNGWDNASDNIKSVILNKLSRAEACYDIIIENLLDNGLIPEEQIEMAKCMIKAAQ
jgi:superfamily II DNA or RNA helicase